MGRFVVPGRIIAIVLQELVTIQFVAVQQPIRRESLVGPLRGTPLLASAPPMREHPRDFCFCMRLNV
ncbi:hypothetical protein QF046_001314 [Microbacterium sp. W4I4]|uniref:hypothetical protein n=1 Tax=Microbacterium sp. W4I4 TaxID=3042295 RepID=UPI002788ACD1|nr:hypothetical protein [Microbacterium sp. W4I4]MDQ0613673.1 hypothetical protein [Microbacterium sp. W4I4]